MLTQYHIDRAAAAAYGVRPSALKAKTKREPIIFARMLAMLLCHELLGHNWNRLKKNYGKLSHTTTRHAVITARDLVSNNNLFREHYHTAKSECMLMLPMIRQNKQRYNMHYSLRSKNFRLNAHSRSVSVTMAQEATIKNNKQLMQLLSRHNYSVQYSIC